MDVSGIVGRVDDVQRSRSWLALPYAVVKKSGDDQGGLQAALLTYYGFLSLLPLLLVFVTVLGFVLEGDPTLRQELVSGALAQVPILGDQLGEVGGLTGSPLALAVGVLGALWGGLGVAQVAQNAVNTVLDVPFRQRPGFLPGRVRSLKFVLLLGGGVVATVALTSVVTVLTSELGGPAAAARILGLLGSTALAVGLFALAFRVLAAAAQPWREVLPGALLGGIGWTLLQLVGGLIASRAFENASQTYGAFAGALGLIAFLSLAAQLFVYAAELNVVVASRLWPRSLAGDPTEADLRVLRRLSEESERRPGQRVDVTFDAETQEDAHLQSEEADVGARR